MEQRRSLRKSTAIQRNAVANKFHSKPRKRRSECTPSAIKAKIRQWTLEGTVIDPGVPVIPVVILEKWHVFIRSVYNHPNLLAHRDVEAVWQLLLFLGAEISFETSDILVELDLEEENQIQQSEFSQTERVSVYCNLEVKKKADVLVTVLGKIEEMQLFPDIGAALIRKYYVMDDFKSALSDMCDIISEYPEILLYPDYLFLYDFLLRFGVSAEAILFEICMTQIRRSSAKVPASTILLMYGLPERDTNEEFVYSTNDQDELYDLMALQDNKLDVKKSLKIKSESRHSSWCSGGDSGFSSLDSDQPENSSDSEVDRRKVRFKEEPEIQFYDVGIAQGRGKRRLRKDGSKIPTPYHCPVCSKSYAYRYNCNIHISKRHPGVELLPNLERKGKKAIFSNDKIGFDCPICPQGYFTKPACQTHIGIFHPKSNVIPHAVSLNACEKESIASPKAKIVFRESSTPYYFPTSQIKVRFDLTESAKGSASISQFLFCDYFQEGEQILLMNEF